ncbi:MAG: hypothetical protein P9M13_00620 [Candidatus Ancaeobacter aquaticus]|nr:hypothetical protein [Candidatus Ancaeobacter aquaticus]
MNNACFKVKKYFIYCILFLAILLLFQMSVSYDVLALSPSSKIDEISKVYIKHAERIHDIKHKHKQKLLDDILSGSFAVDG